MGKKEAMERGDDDVLQRVGKGKDILSVMSECGSHD